MRKIKDALSNGELIYFKGHAKATYTSDGRTVEEIINEIKTGDSKEETDPIFSASPAASITEEKKTEWDNKQDKIDDLATIRSGAEKGATALQSVPSEYITETELNNKGYATTAALNEKVDKVTGKQLSTEDFTSALRTKLEGLSNYDDTVLETALNTLRNDFDKLVSGDTTTAIKTFNEVIAFLDGIQDTQDLSNIIASIEQQIAGKMDKVTLATVATSGNYNDLSNKPTIPAEQVNADWNATSGKAQILNKPTIPTSLSQLNGDSTHRVVTDTEKSTWNAKSNFDGDYNSLKNKPTIPSAVTESTVSGWGFTKNTGTYSKPSGGIPKSDLASSVLTSLSNADNAFTGSILGFRTGDFAPVLEVSINGENKTPNTMGKLDLGNTITGINVNGQSVTPSNGVVTIPTATTSASGTVTLSNATNSTSTTAAATPKAVKAAYDLANGKQSKLVSGTSIKTINGESILGSGDITISGGSSEANVAAVDTGDVIDDVAVNYATKAYVDGLIGDINNMLVSIINGGSSLITFTVATIQYQAEEGMTWEQFASSKYNTGSITIQAPYVTYAAQAITLNGSMVGATDTIINNAAYGLIV